MGFQISTGVCVGSRGDTSGLDPSDEATLLRFIYLGIALRHCGEGVYLPSNFLSQAIAAAKETELVMCFLRHPPARNSPRNTSQADQSYCSCSKIFITYTNQQCNL